MQHRNVSPWPYGILTLLAVSLLGMAMPLTARAGGVHVSVGLELPIPVAVVPAPVVVAPAPVLVQQPPVLIAQSAPVIVQPAPAVVLEPRRVVYPGHLPPGLAKKFYGYQYGHGEGFGKPWKHHHQDD